MKMLKIALFLSLTLGYVTSNYSMIATSQSAAPAIPAEIKEVKILRLAPDVEKDIIARCSLPEEAKELHRNLRAFYADTDVQELFVDPAARKYLCPRSCADDKFKTGLEELNKPGKKFKFKDKEDEQKALLQKICNKFEIQCLNGGGTYVLVSDKMWPGHIVRIPKCRWIDLGEWYEGRLIVSPYQNISRVFYNDKFTKLATAEGLRHCALFREDLWHIPGQPDELSDDNYIVVSTFVPHLPGLETNKANFARLVGNVSNGHVYHKDTYIEDGDDKKEVVHQEFSVVCEFVQAVTGVGFWDLENFKNVFLVEINGVWQIVFADKEKPGLGGGDLKNFFHKDINEFNRNVACGMDAFRYSLLGLPRPS